MQTYFEILPSEIIIKILKYVYLDYDLHIVFAIPYLKKYIQDVSTLKQRIYRPIPYVSYQYLDSFHRRNDGHYEMPRWRRRSYRPIKRRNMLSLLNS